MRGGIRTMPVSGMMVVIALAGLLGLITAGCGVSGSHTPPQILRVAWFSGDPAIDKLMIEADRSMDNSVRFPLYNQAEQMLINNVSYCPLVQMAVNYRVRANVRGYNLDPQGSVATPDWPNVAITA